jgi:glycosyltransferase involved in cell wall biosynthesis
MVKVLVVGQTPPPFGGQIIMTKILLDGNYGDIRLFHAPISFSRGMDEVGKFRFKKILKLFPLVLNIVYQRFRYGIDILYYTPAGPDLLPMYRDFAILLSTRWLFPKCVFHFHSAGGSDNYHRLGSISRFLFRRTYFHVDSAIRLSEFSPRDGEEYRARSNIIIPNGIPDLAKGFVRRPTTPPVKILFVGVVRESKGILILLEAANRLAKKHLEFEIRIVGKCESPMFEQCVKNTIQELQIESHVHLCGVVSPEEKMAQYREANIFCFPTFFESESLPMVVMEAMQFSMPIVATRWRGIPSMIEEEGSGFMVPIQDSIAIAQKLELLIKNPEKTQQMGQRGRELFLNKYSIKNYRESMGHLFRQVAGERS